MGAPIEGLRSRGVAAAVADEAVVAMMSRFRDPKKLEEEKREDLESQEEREEEKKRKSTRIIALCRSTRGKVMYGCLEIT